MLNEAPTHTNAELAALNTSSATQGRCTRGVEANLGVCSDTNFYGGFGQTGTAHGVFVATYESYRPGEHVEVHVHLPGGFEFSAHGHVQFLATPQNDSAGTPGVGIHFDDLAPEHAALVERFARKRPTRFYSEAA